MKINTFFSIHCFNLNFLWFLFFCWNKKMEKKKRPFWGFIFRMRAYNFDTHVYTHKQRTRERQKNKTMKEKGRRPYVIFTAKSGKIKKNLEISWKLWLKTLFWAAETKHTNQFHMHEYLKLFFFFLIHETHITIYRIVKSEKNSSFSFLFCMCLMTCLRCIFSTLNHNQSCGHSFAMHKSIYSLLNAYCLCHQYALWFRVHVFKMAIKEAKRMHRFAHAILSHWLLAVCDLQIQFIYHEWKAHMKNSKR